MKHIYDDLDLVVQVNRQGSLLATQSYDAWGNRYRRQFQPGATEEWTYDPTGTRVTQWTLGTVGAVPVARTYSYDKANRLTSAGEWSSLKYDTNSRLIQATGFGMTDDLVHDAYGNNISSVSTGNVHFNMNNYTFDPLATNLLPGQTKTGGITDTTYDNFGEMTQTGKRTTGPYQLTLMWDGLGRLASTRDGEAGCVQTNRYTADGLRVVRRDPLHASRSIYYAYARDGHVMSVYDLVQDPTLRLPWNLDVIYLGNEAIAEADGAAVHALHNDHLGSPRAVSNPGGVLEGTQAYGPYGEPLAHTGYTPTIGYTGHIQNEPTGLIYMRGRFYSPSWHRFVNSDQGVDTNSINQVSYVLGSPLMATDPTGMKIPWEFVFKHPDIAINKIGEPKDGSRKNISSRASNFSINLGFKDALGSGMGWQRNAFRHAMWEAMITSKFGEIIAARVGFGHEENPYEANDITQSTPSSKIAKTFKEADDICDLMNNEIGRKVGMSNSCTSTSDLAREVLKEYAKNGLWQAIKNEDGTYTVSRVKLSEDEFQSRLGKLNSLDDDGKTRTTTTE